MQVCASARCDECVVYLLLHTTGSGTLLTSCWTPKRFSQTDALHYCWSMLDLLICPLLIIRHQHTLRQCVCLWPVSPCLIVQSGCLHQLLTQTKGVRIHVSHSHIQLVNPPVSTLESRLDHPESRDLPLWASSEKPSDLSVAPNSFPEWFLCHPEDSEGSSADCEEFRWLLGGSWFWPCDFL